MLQFVYRVHALRVKTQARDSHKKTEQWRGAEVEHLDRQNRRRKKRPKGASTARERRSEWREWKAGCAVERTAENGRAEREGVREEWGRRFVYVTMAVASWLMLLPSPPLLRGMVLV